MDDLIKECQNNLSKSINHDNNIKNINLNSLGAGIQDFKFLNIINAICSEEQIAHTYKKNELMQTIIIAKIDSL